LLRLLTSALGCQVVLYAGTDVSVEHADSRFRIEELRLGFSSETSVSAHVTTECHNPKITTLPNCIIVVSLRIHVSRDIPKLILSSSTSRSFYWFSSSAFPTKTLYILFSPVRSTCSAHLLLVLIILIIFGEEYKL
jgi:hypothetical protein